MDVTVIIVNWNTKGLLYNCIKSIKENAGKIDYEIIVVDNNSSDHSPDMVAKEFPDVKLIINETNLGFAAANNKAIPLAKGRYVLLLNSDTLVKDCVIEKTVIYADENKEAAAVGCQVRVDDETVQMTCFRFPSLLNITLMVFGLSKLFKYNRFFGRELMLWWKRDSERELDVASGMYLLVRKEAIEDVGLMDEDYFFYYEETDWCYRFKQSGWKTLFYPYSSIIHVGGGGRSSAKAKIKMFVQHQKSHLIYLRKHYGPVTVLTARILLVLGYTIRTIIWCVVTCVRKCFRCDNSFHLTLKQKTAAAVKYLMFGIEP